MAVMIIGVDVDGVLADFTTPFAKEFPQCDGVQDEPYFPPVWDFPQYYGATDADVDKVWKDLNSRPDWWHRLQPLPNAFRSISRLQMMELERGFDLYFITKRRFVDAKWTTENWLQLNGYGFGQKPTVIITPVRKNSVIRDLGCDYFIDDKPSNLTKIGKTKGILVLAGHNRGSPISAHRVSNIEMALNEIEAGRV